ncbi:hypothetical protein ED551_05030 [Muribaculaceae bacterium Isolate-013 (NCI)]|nr:hypothetical protein ED551_05030 [Muribaculaceae bacterium Isolate-013 (NCI)]
MRKLLVCLFFSVVVSCAAGVLDNIVVSCAAGLLDNMIANVSKTKNIQGAPYECYYAGVDSISEFVILKSSSNNMFVLAPELLDSIKNETTESDVVNSYGAGIVSLDFYECFMRCFPPKEYGRLINMPYDPVSQFRYKEFEMNKNFQIVKPENKIDAFIVILVRGESYNRYRIPRIISQYIGDLPVQHDSNDESSSDIPFCAPSAYYKLYVPVRAVSE